MKKCLITILLVSAFLALECFESVANGQTVVRDGISYRTISAKEYRDKMKAGWIGQIAGVCWGAPTEFHYQDVIMPADKMPLWKPEMINDAFGQDDLYVEMTFLRSMEEHGLDVSIRQAGIDFANSEYGLAHANYFGRRNLRLGIAPPDSGHPKFTEHSDDIDYQIEADFSGLISPGMPNNAIKMGNVFGRLMNYGDGMYAGIFVGAMYAEAFFEKDMKKVIEVALESIPADSQYAEMVRDILKWYEEEPNDWEKTWEKINAKYQHNPDYRRFACDPGTFNIDAKINGAYILMGMLYGQGDLDQTIIISARCGQDSDCNPSNAAGVLFTSLGFSKLPARFSEKLDETRIFSHTAYNFPALIDVCEKLTLQALKNSKGFVEKNEQGEEIFFIPVVKPEPGPLEQSWDPKPAEESKFTEEELKKITWTDPVLNMGKYVNELFPDWSIRLCGPDMHPGIRENWLGRDKVLMTHPFDNETGCVLFKTVELPKGKSKLELVVSHHPDTDWQLIVRVNDKVLKDVIVNKALDDEKGWAHLDVDLSEFAGQTVNLELENKSNDWFCEAAYWAEINIKNF
ncbi:MAG: ADP-ribosylglycohydrolase family protein [Planctomycetia bacterium]|nr:ADP-ribosylglycohydrolase family protein [Planctomycetia bacterium]